MLERIKVFSGGSVTIGSTASPTVNAVMHQIIGGKTVFSDITTSVTSAPLIVGQNAVSSSPGFAFAGDYQTGIAHPASSVLAITISNSEKFRFNSSGQILNKNSTSSVSTPDYSWDSDPNTGIYRPGADILGLVVNGAEAFRITGSQALANGSGGASTPQFSFYGNQNTGIFNPATNAIGFSTNGSERVELNSTGQILSYNSPHTASTPDYSWYNDANTGIYNPASDVLALSTNGSERARFTSTGDLYVGGTWTNGARLIVTGASDAAALTATVNHTSDYAYCQVNYVNKNTAKGYALINTASGSAVETFKVSGNGDCWNTNNVYTSDKNLKENIDSLTGALSKIKQLQGVRYNFKASYLGADVAARKEIGLLAQDVEPIIPEVVATDDNGMKGIKYANIVAYLIEAIKEQDKKMTQLQSDLNNCCSSKSPSQNNRTITNPENNTSNPSEGYTGNSFIKQNTPNPFDKETVINYFVEERSAASSILVFDMNGKLLKTYKLNGNGNGNLTISANDFQPGMYYYSLIINNKEVGTKKMILTE